MEFLLVLKTFATEVLQYWKQLLVLIIVAALMYGSYDLGIANSAKKYENQIQELNDTYSKAHDDDVKKHEDFVKASNQLAMDFEQWKLTHPKVKIKTVTEYVTVIDDSACKINVGFVKLHEESLFRTFETSLANNIDSGIALSTVGEVVSENYGICLTEMKKLSTLQDIVKAYQKTQEEVK